MKIIHLHFGKDGGAERFFVHLLGAFASRDVQQTAFIRPRRGWRGSIDPRVRIVEGTFRRISISRFFLAAKLRRLMRDDPPDVLMAWMPRASRFMPQWNGGVRVARLGDYPPRLDYFEQIDVLICNTPGIAEHVVKIGWKRPVHVISNFTATRIGTPVDRARVNTPADAFVVVGVGRFVHRKGFHTLIEALKSSPGTILWLVGDGEERENLQKLAVSLGVQDRIRWLGWQADPLPYIAAGDVFSMPSLHEPLGNVILEAWAAGKPVVSSLSEGPRWMMQDGVDGLLHTIGDAAGLAAAIERLRHDAALRQVIGAGGRATLAARFSEEGVSNSYLQLFNNLRPKAS
jgi:glycosyltransferase involved in cell wall biosynthesis